MKCLWWFCLVWACFFIRKAFLNSLAKWWRNCGLVVTAHLWLHYIMWLCGAEEKNRHFFSVCLWWVLSGLCVKTPKALNPYSTHCLVTLITSVVSGGTLPVETWSHLWRYRVQRPINTLFRKSFGDKVNMGQLANGVHMLSDQRNAMVPNIC